MTDSFRHRPAVRLFLLMLPIVCTLAVGAFPPVCNPMHCDCGIPHLKNHR